MNIQRDVLTALSFEMVNLFGSALRGFVSEGVGVPPGLGVMKLTTRQFLKYLIHYFRWN